jgi:hypothetical protein
MGIQDILYYIQNRMKNRWESGYSRNSIIMESVNIYHHNYSYHINIYNTTFKLSIIVCLSTVEYPWMEFQNFVAICRYFVVF